MDLVGIGIRATPKEIFYCVITNKAGTVEVIAYAKLIIPVALSFPERLNFIRKTFKDIIFEYKCNRAGIRVTEDVADANIDRVSYEAVIQELFASSTVERYLTGKISTMCPRLGISRKEYRPLVDTKMDYDVIEGFASFNSSFKEAMLVCIASFTL